MDCTQSGYKTFLVSCNVALLFVGLSVLLLGTKMQTLLSVILLMDVPLIGQAINAIIATGFFISLAGVTGIIGACCEYLWLIMTHLAILGIIVIMEFGLGVTLLVVRKTVENYIATMDCNTNCVATLDSLVLDYALPSAGLMLTIIIVEATMIYSALKLCSFINDAPKIVNPLDSDILTQNVQMQRVPSPYPGPRNSPAHTPRMEYLRDLQPAYALQSASPSFAATRLTPRPPPRYATLMGEYHMPPTYLEAVPQPSPVFQNLTSKTTRPRGLDSV